MSSIERLPTTSVLKRQTAACAIVGGLLALIIGALYLQHRQREWLLRREQARHRLDVAFELISGEIRRVHADAMYLANRELVQQFVSGDESAKAELTADLMQFVRHQELYDQIRLLDLSGREKMRINFSPGQATAVGESALQNKSDRYYYQEALALQPGEIFVSEFDLNLEHGQIERPLKPVIRLVTPVVDQQDQVGAFLVLNYLGSALLSELDESTVPGLTMLLRRDGHYIRAVSANDSWGWLLNHDCTFATQFPQEWSRLGDFSEFHLTKNGAFTAKSIPLGRMTFSDSAAGAPTGSSGSPGQAASRDSITVISYLPRSAVFAASNELLQRLLIVAAGVLALAILFSRTWARAMASRQQQAVQIAASEEQLRELSSRLLRIQEDERRAISREIHDELGQQATAINLDLKLAQRHVDTQAATPHLQRAINENETLLQTLHDFAKRVRPAVLDDLGLRDAIESHLSDFQERTGVECDMHLDFHSDDIPDEIADNSFRLLQESLNNVAKHAGATKVVVEVSVAGQRNNELLISVCDDGCGHPPTSSGDGLGLVGMRERVDLLAGHFEVQSSSDLGTSIKIRLPLAKHQQRWGHV